MAAERILLVDDDRAMLDRLRKQLAREGYEVACTEDGAGALRRVVEFEPDLVILDISLPSDGGAEPLDGIEVLRRVREDFETPVLMLSATSVGAVKVMALTLGADDYLTKPFDPQEFLARVRAILRRMTRTAPSASELRFPGLRIDPESRRVWRDDQPVELTAIEFELLLTLAKRPNRVFSRDQLIEMAWKHSYYGVPKVVDVHIGHIRKKIEEDPLRPRYIITVRGVGYRFGEE
ncbi:MAG: response regulator transcription factor [Candidatus Hydrogenedentes bacterium]|nr:response regulator transcription factor [Candidatus Hydrogenedentota bacterium]